MSANKSRADDQTVLGVSMPKTLKDRIAKLADADRRSMAQWSVMQLEKAVSELENKLAQTADANPPQTTDPNHPPQPAIGFHQIQGKQSKSAPRSRQSIKPNLKNGR